MRAVSGGASLQVEDLASYTLKKPEKVAADPLFDVADKLSQEFVRVREVGGSVFAFCDLAGRDISGLRACVHHPPYRAGTVATHLLEL